MRALTMFGGLLCAASALVVMPSSAGAAEQHGNCATFDSQGNVLSVVPNCTETIAGQPQPPQSFPAQNPCTGDPGTITMLTGPSIFHVNINGASDIWATGTQSGTITFTPDDPTLASGSGHWTSWFGASLNNRNTVTSDTFNATMRTTDGHNVTVHGQDHITFNANGTITSMISLAGLPVCH